MTNNGKQLESLVAFVEKTLLPEGFSVTTNERVFDDDGIQIAEFDIEIRGKIGSTDISWLIECRDRPTSGPAPGAWIEQLVGRRSRFGFNKVTAVSTTGFSAGAVNYALTSGIEIREVKSLQPDEFSDWLYIQYIHQVTRISKLEHLTIFIDDTVSKEVKEAFSYLINTTNGYASFLKSSTTGKLVSPKNAFSSAASNAEGVFTKAEKNAEEVPVRLKANYSDDDYFSFETSKGEVKITSIEFEGRVSVISERIPLFATSEYRNAETQAVISQVASFAPQSIHGINFSTEFHRMNDTGETHILLRRLKDEE